MNLDRFSGISKVLARDYHLACLHNGPQLVLSAIMRKYYIICGKRVVKSILSKCPKCLPYSDRCLRQQMSGLPLDPQNLEFPFATTGLDYAGPIKVTPSRRRGGIFAFLFALLFRSFMWIVSDMTTQTLLVALL